MLPEICDALDRVNIKEPFPIQEMTLPVALMGTDLIGQARTGTGKTLGFGIPLLQRTISPGEADYEELAAPGKPQALVVTPTRELTIQVAKDLVTASTVRTVRVLTIYGGVAYEPQLDALKSGVDVVVGTPGRLLDLANRGVLDLSHIKVLVLDEADEMLDLGFLPDVERILRKTPELRQTMLFSATMPSAVIALARTHMRHPLNIRAESHEDTQMVPTTAQFVYRAHELDKPEVVARILQAEDRGRVMIFCRTKREASRLTDDLQERGFQAAAIHGDLNQQARERALTRFRGDKIDVLVCTDVAARGIDVEGVTHVINNTCPEDEKTYIHRIGRTGRAGASGIAVTFVDWPDVTRWKVINKALDLPYDEPQEIYSTSPELYHDLGIPSEAKGRIRTARAPQETRERTDRPRGRRGDESDERPARKRNRNRTRKRTRAGQPLEERADVTTKTEVPAPSEQLPAEDTAPRKPRKRTRKPRGAEATTPAPGGVDEAAQATADTLAEPTPTAPAEATADAPVEAKPSKRTRTRKTAATKAAAPAEEAAATAEAPAGSAAEGSAEAKSAKRTRTRKAAAAKAAAPAGAAEAAEPSTEAPAEAAAEPTVEVKPAKRTRARKTATAKAAAPAEAAEAPAEAKPAKRTRKTAAAKAAAPSEEAAATAEAPAEAKPAKRTRKTAAAKVAAPAEEAAAAPAGSAAEGSAEAKPAKRTRTRKTAAAKAAAPAEAAEAPEEAKPAKRTRKAAAAKPAAPAEEAAAAAEKPVKRARKAAAAPLFKAPE
ncbi:DEAD/DEAH box helicase [Kribbella sp. HUAS MG21]|uniref:RNA helicase n=1 Tax=Kribbella sp. HUAS MG21 TaxID=3160966 RepID=A0AAU7T2W2_9ACTN